MTKIDEFDWVMLRDLIDRGMSLGDIVTAIDEGYLVVCDEFGRHVAATAQQARIAIKALAFHKQMRAEPDSEEPLPHNWHLQRQAYLREWHQEPIPGLTDSGLVMCGNQVLTPEMLNAAERSGSPAPVPVRAKPAGRFKTQDAAILDELKRQGHEPIALPRNEKGKAGVPAAIWAAVKVDREIFLSKKVFDTAWERLTARGEIGYKN
jgi:hypothetical protein